MSWLSNISFVMVIHAVFFIDLEQYHFKVTTSTLPFYRVIHKTFFPLFWSKFNNVVS